MEWWRYAFPFTALTAIGSLGAGLLALAFAGDFPLAAFVLAFGWLVATPAVAVLELMTILGWSPLEALRSEEGDADETDPIEELRQRYVEGELTEEEFERRLDGLLGERDGSAGSTREREVEVE